MRKDSINRCCVALLLSVACALILLAQAPSMTADDSAKLKNFLRYYLADSHIPDDTMTRYVAAFADLKDEGTRQVIVYFTDQRSCGSGGCTTLILAPENSSYRVVTAITIGWPPIRVLSTKSNGWHNLGLWVRGGGIRPGYEAELRFDGHTYPTNPSILPARRLSEKVEGEVVIPSAEDAKPLYP
jgi:hypothetical protein